MTNSIQPQCFQGMTTNPELLDVALRVFTMAQAATARALEASAGGRLDTLPKKGLERTIYNFLEPRLSQSATGLLARRTMGLISRVPGSPDKRRIGDLRLDYSKKEPVLRQARENGFFSGIKLSKDSTKCLGLKKTSNKPTWAPADKTEALIEFINWKTRLHSKPSPLVQPLAAGTPEPPKAKELLVKLQRLKAIKRVGWEVTDWDGKDRINCGGDGFDSLKYHRKVNQFHVHTFTRDDHDFNIVPDATFVKFPLRARATIS